jgi:hypothetical protein
VELGFRFLGELLSNTFPQLVEHENTPHHNSGLNAPDIRAML